MALLDLGGGGTDARRIGDFEVKGLGGDALLGQRSDRLNAAGGVAGADDD